MAKSIAIALALAVFVGGAHAKYWAGGGGYACSGAITEIMCEQDQAGMLAGIYYYNDASGWSSFCGSSSEGYGYGHGYSPAPPCKDCDGWKVPPGEAIVNVEACRGGKYGYTTITFWTDGGASFTCGSGAYEYTPDNYDSYGQQYQNYGYGAEGGEKSRKGRALLDGEAGADIDHFMKKGAGWGWKSKCQVYESPKQPVWNPRTGGPGYIGGKDEWFKGGYDSGNWGYSSHKFGKSKAWKQYGSYYNYAGEDGKYTRYYKDYNTYKEESVDYASNPGAYDYKPGYYFKELFPLAGFEAKCDKNGYIYNVYGWCWNHNNVLPPIEDKVVVEITIILEPGVPCPPSVDMALLKNLTQRLEEELPCVEKVTADIKSFSCVDGGADGNSTITGPLFLYPEDSEDCSIEAIEETLAALTGFNICSVDEAACDATSVQSITLALLPEEARQQMLMSRAGRTSARRAVVLSSRRSRGRRN